MPLTLNVGLSRKVADNHYGSRGASINVEVEVESALVQDPAKFQQRLRQIFGLVRTSLTEELNGANNGQSGTPKADMPDSTQRSKSNGQGNGQRTARPATQSQIKAVYGIAKGQRLDLGQLLQERFHVTRPEDLSLKEASQLIGDLKSQNPRG